MESKRNKRKANKFPETAFAFYIKLYNKQKGSSETKSTEIWVCAKCPIFNFNSVTSFNPNSLDGKIINMCVLQKEELFRCKIVPIIANADTSNEAECLLSLHNSLNPPNCEYQSNLIEATKSWLSLTEEEKQEVHESYKEKEHKFKLQFFDQLKNAEPFMKVKDQTRSKNVDLNSSSSVIQEPEEHIKEVRLQTETEHANQIVNCEDMNLSYDGELVSDIGPEHDQDERHETIKEPIQHTNEETPRTFLVKPLPPTFKTSKDLFYMLNPAGGAESVSWTSLPTSEKNQYSRAASLLKTDYITKYKEYLESLTPRELFDYYNKTLF